MLQDMPLVETVSDSEPTKQIDLNTDVLAGYVTGLTKDGAFLFQVIGTNPGLAELIGMHEHAKEKIRQIYAAKQGTADAITLKMLTELGQMVAAVDQKLSRLTSKVAALESKSTNSLT